MVRVTVHYVDGSRVTCPAEDWVHVRADGVDTVVVANPSGCTTFHGRSAYWLYPEGEAWVAGAASFGYDRHHVPEVLVHPDGVMETRRFEYVPDLKHEQVKLGWWWPGTTGRPVV
jgi:hypothetical protein